MSTKPSLDFDAIYPAARELARRAEAPALVRNVLVGTAGWTDPSLIRTRTFYPRGASKPEARLRYYSGQFGLVEVDASYYTILAPDVAKRWVSWTPESFRFNVKVHASMTGHPVDIARLPQALREVAAARLGDTRVRAESLPPELRAELELAFEGFLRPLTEANRLGCLLFQFPPWFDALSNARRIEAVRERWPTQRIAVEFRHASWLAEERRRRVVDLLSKLGISYVVVDEPRLGGRGVPPSLLLTNPELAVVRLHGRNEAGWARGKSVAQRFNYLYSEPELREWVPRVRELERDAERVHVVFNNCVRDFAVVNAKGLSVLLGEPKTPEA